MSSTNLEQNQPLPVGDNANGIKATHQQFDNLNRYATNASVAIPMEVFEKMYLNPETRVKGELRKTFANPTPL
jgi:uncharacterized protein